MLALAEVTQAIETKSKTVPEEQRAPTGNPKELVGKVQFKKRSQLTATATRVTHLSLVISDSHTTLQDNSLKLAVQLLAQATASKLRNNRELTALNIWEATLSLQASMLLLTHTSLKLSGLQHLVTTLVAHRCKSRTLMLVIWNRLIDRLRLLPKIKTYLEARMRPRGIPTFISLNLITASSLVKLLLRIEASINLQLTVKV